MSNDNNSSAKNVAISEFIQKWWGGVLNSQQTFEKFSSDLNSLVNSQNSELIEKMEELIKQFKTKEYCQSCHKNNADTPHTCPYLEDINEDSSLCNCCDECSEMCAQDI